MAIQLEHRFGRDSRVRDYWVAASEGFGVELPDGRAIGTVRQVVHERDGRAAALVVETPGFLGRRERVVLGAEAVEEVAPWRSTLVVPAGEAPESASAAVGRTLRPLAAVAAEGAYAAREHSLVAVRAGRSRWAAARRAIEGGLARASRSVASALASAAATVRTRAPAAQALIRRVWAAIVAAVVGVAAAVAAQLARLIRALVAWLAAARSAARP